MPDMQSSSHASSDNHRLKIAVLVSGSGSNLQVLIDAMQAGSLPINIVGVISNKADAFALTRAKNADISTCVLSHVRDGKPFVPSPSTDLEDLKKNNPNLKKMGIKTFERHAMQQIHAWQPDLIVLAGFMRVLSSEFITGVPVPMINLHPSLLPKFKGLDTHARAIEARESYHGCSVHLVTAELDAGQVLTQAVMPIGNDLNEPINLVNLQKKVQKLEHKLLPWTILLIAQGVLNLSALTPCVIPVPIKLWFDSP